MHGMYGCMVVLMYRMVGVYDIRYVVYNVLVFPSIPKLTPLCVGDHSTLLVSFHLQRHMGDFVIQVRINHDNHANHDNHLV